MQCCCMRILLAKMLYPGPCSLIQRHSCWLFNLSGTVCWNQCPARWLVSVLSLRLHSTHCASSLEGKITGSISVRTLWTSSATGWGRTKLGLPFPLQRTDYLVVCFCRFVILFFFLFHCNLCEVNIVQLVSSCLLVHEKGTILFNLLLPAVSVLLLMTVIWGIAELG